MEDTNISKRKQLNKELRKVSSLFLCSILTNTENCDKFCAFQDLLPVAGKVLNINQISLVSHRYQKNLLGLYRQNPRYSQPSTPFPLLPRTENSHFVGTIVRLWQEKDYRVWDVSSPLNYEILNTSLTILQILLIALSVLSTPLQGFYRFQLIINYQLENNQIVLKATQLDGVQTPIDLLVLRCPNNVRISSIKPQLSLDTIKYRSNKLEGVREYPHKLYQAILLV